MVMYWNTLLGLFLLNGEKMIFKMFVLFSDSLINETLIKACIMADFFENGISSSL